MARVFVTSNDMDTRVEILRSDDAYQAECDCCASWNLVANMHEQWSLADTIEVAVIHADKCQGVIR